VVACCGDLTLFLSQIRRKNQGVRKCKGWSGKIGCERRKLYLARGGRWVSGRWFSVRRLWVGEYLMAAG
jgi:hypothetical protein